MIVIKIYEFHVLTDSIFHSYVFVLFFFKANMVETCRNNNKIKKKTNIKNGYATLYLPSPSTVYEKSSECDQVL